MHTDWKPCKKCKIMKPPKQICKVCKADRQKKYFGTEAGKAARKRAWQKRTAEGKAKLDKRKWRANVKRMREERIKTRNATGDSNPQTSAMDGLHLSN